MFSTVKVKKIIRMVSNTHYFLSYAFTLKQVLSHLSSHKYVITVMVLENVCDKHKYKNNSTKLSFLSLIVTNTYIIRITEVLRKTYLILKTIIP